MDKSFSSENMSSDIKNAIKKKDAQSLLSSLNDEDKKLLDSLLKDEKARNEFLSSPEARMLFSTLFKGRQ